MANFCSSCGSPIDKKTGKCLNCAPIKKEKKNKVKGKK